MNPRFTAPYQLGRQDLKQRLTERCSSKGTTDSNRLFDKFLVPECRVDLLSYVDIVSAETRNSGKRKKAD